MRASRLKLMMGLALIVAAGGLLWKIWPRECLLLDRATPIIKTDDLYGERFNYGIGVQWLTDHDILFSRFEGSNHKDRVIYRRDVITRQERKLPALTRACDTLRAEVVDNQCVSPDGKWFVRSARWDDCLLAEVNGKRNHLYPSVDSADYRSLVWMADSRHWLEIYESNGEARCVMLHDALHPNVSVPIPLGDKGRLFASLETVLSPQQALSVIEPEPLYDPSDSRLILNPHPIATIYRMSLNAAKPSSQYKIAFPYACNRVDGYVSPQGDRIAWQVTTSRQEEIPAWLRRLLPFLRTGEQKRVELWISNLDGSRMHEIGRITKRVKAASVDDDDDLWLGNIRWLPGGKRLSFEYKDLLYTVPAD